MHEAVPVTRPLQNHFPVFTHFTTQDALWMPQYLQFVSIPQTAAHWDIREDKGSY